MCKGLSPWKGVACSGQGPAAPCGVATLLEAVCPPWPAFSARPAPSWPCRAMPCLSKGLETRPARSGRWRYQRPVHPIAPLLDVAGTAGGSAVGLASLLEASRRFVTISQGHHVGALEDGPGRLSDCMRRLSPWIVEAPSPFPVPRSRPPGAWPATRPYPLGERAGAAGRAHPDKYCPRAGQDSGPGYDSLRCRGHEDRRGDKD